MRCEEAQSILLDHAGGPVEEAREHLRACARCASLVEGWAELQPGWRACAAEAAPEPSIGFAARVARRLGDERAGVGGAFFENVGRRFVYAALLLAFTLFLVLVLPPSGPVRAPSNSEIYLTQPEAVTAQNDTIFPGQSVTDAAYHPAPGAPATGGPGSK